MRLPRRSRAVAALAAALTAGTLFTVVPGGPAHADPPPNPSDTQIQQAQGLKDSLANQVGTLSAQIATMQAQLAQLQAKQELAEQKLAYALQKLERAKEQATAARAQVDAAQQQVHNAQQEFVAYAQAAYMSGQVGGTTESLLTAQDPNALLQQGALQQYQASHQVGAIDNLQRANVAKSNADALARRAVVAQKQATDAATQAKQDADAAVLAARAQQQQLQSSLSSTQSRLDNARQQLATLNGERQRYLTWRAEQIRIAQEKARQERLARERAEALARERAREQQQQHNGGGGSGGGGVSTGPAPTPSGGGWTAARGRTAVSRAEHYLGCMYAWAGGNASGPTYGVCAGDGAFNDCHVVGFDCSGLVMYAWGPYISLDHYAATQYTQAGSYHPSTGNLMPGDLVFWSSDGTIGGIHHVAIYIGDGNVIQAPESGSVIQITPLGQVSWGYFGATRPLT
jgi:cell wall-associated NlpC family hydrolase